MCSNLAAANITELPLGCPGKLFRSAMPFSSFDYGLKVFPRIKTEGISVVVLLADDKECIQKTGRDLRAFYRQEGLDVVYLPIRDFSVPEVVPLKGAVVDTLERLLSGSNVLVHCHAGIGRTGIFSACLAKHALGIDGKEAIRWVRAKVPGALETSEQIEFVLDF